MEDNLVQKQALELENSLRRMVNGDWKELVDLYNIDIVKMQLGGKRRTQLVDAIKNDKRNEQLGRILKLYDLFWEEKIDIEFAKRYRKEAEDMIKKLKEEIDTSISKSQ